jgi:hypothetical protein
LTEEERLISIQENALGFSRTPVTRIDAVFRKYSRLRQLNSSQLADAAAHLNIEVESTQSTSQLTQFYSMFQSAEDTYSLEQLLVLGIFLGYGRHEEKARLLFEVLDTKGQRSLSSDDIYRLVELMYEVACKRLPILVTGALERDRIQQYMYRMLSGRAPILSRLTSVLSEARECIDIDAFTKTLSGPLWQKLLVPSSFRSYVSKAFAGQLQTMASAPLDK